MRHSAGIAFRCIANRHFVKHRRDTNGQARQALVAAVTWPLVYRIPINLIVMLSLDQKYIQKFTSFLMHSIIISR